MDWQERIAIDPNILVGKPVIKGTGSRIHFRVYPGVTMRLPANESFPLHAVLVLRESGHDLAWVHEDARGSKPSHQNDAAATP